MFITKIRLLVLGLVLTSDLALAEEQKKFGWKGEVGAGYIATTGNSDTSKFNAKAEGTLEKLKWRHNIKATALSSQSNDIKDVEKYFIAGKSDFKYNELSYVFGRADYDTDKFSSFDYQYTATFGIGHRHLKNYPTMTLDVDAGIGLKGFKVKGANSDMEGMGRLAAKYIWEFREKSNFNQELAAEFASSFDVYKSITGLTVQILGSFALGLSYTVKYTTDVQPDFEKIDTETTVNLLYTF